MRDERLQINDFVLQQSDRSRPRVMVAIDEFEINLEIGKSGIHMLARRRRDREKKKKKGEI